MNRFLPVSVERDQLSCLPEPLTPAKGFSWSRHTSPWRSATFFIISMASWFWSQAELAVGEHRRHLMLSRGHLVVLGLRQDAQSPERLIQILHIRGHSGADGAEVMVLQLLPLGGLCAEQGPAAHSQVLPLLIEGLVNQEILLLRPHLGSDPLRLCVAEEPEDPDRLAADLVHGPQQRRLLVQGFAGVGAEDGGDAQACPP